MSVFRRRRHLCWLGLATLALAGGCSAYKHITSNPYRKMDHGPDSSAIVVLDARLYADEDPDATVRPFWKRLLHDVFEELLGRDDDPEEIKGYRLEVEGGALRSVSSNKTIQGFSTKGHLVFLDVPPGEILLTSVRGYRLISSWERRDIYDCESKGNEGNDCPKYWVYRFPTEALGLEGVRRQVSAGEVVYLGHLHAAGRYAPPPYSAVRQAIIEDEAGFGYSYDYERAELETVDVVAASMTATAADERAACAAVLDRMGNQEWKGALNAHLDRMESEVATDGR